MSLKIENTEVKTGQKFYGKTIYPGQQELSIEKIELKESRFKAEAYDVLLYVKSRDVDSPDFEGWMVDKEDPKKGTLPYQTGIVKLSRYAFEDATINYPGGSFDKKRQDEMVTYAKRLATLLGDKMSKFITTTSFKDELDLFQQMSAQKEAFENVWFTCNVAGKQYQNKAGYKAWELYVPNFKKEDCHFSQEASEVSDFVKDLYIMKLADENDGTIPQNQNAVDTGANLSDNFDTSNDNPFGGSEDADENPFV